MGGGGSTFVIREAIASERGPYPEQGMARLPFPCSQKTLDVVMWCDT